jgi:thiol-disulfide isomerase/thioredoxin
MARLYFDVLVLYFVTIFSAHAQQGLPLNLGKTNFTEVVSKEDISVTLVMFYAPWCGYSKSFLPIYDEIAWTLKDESNIAIAKVDAVENEALFYSESIEGLGFPTLMAYIKGGAPILFNEEREKQNVLNFVRRLASSPASSLETEGGIDVFKLNHLTKMEPVAILVTSASTPDSVLLDSFEYACKKIQRLKCALGNDGSFFLDNGQSNAGVVMIRNFDKETSVVTAPDTVLAKGDALFGWMQIASYPTFPIFNEENADLLFTDKRPGYNTHVLIVLDPTTLESKELLESIRSNVVSHTAFEGNCVFAYVDHTNESDLFVQGTLNDIGLPSEELAGSSVAVLVIKSMSDKIKFFRMGQETVVSSVSLTQWLGNVLGDTVKPSRTIDLS